ncbi:hypothetical protein [Pseudonocardia zijingensis]|jgi:hypothetical protein|uniref:Uncharacterized protein n=1 Tax=Pseudonocardia zijingensis TaxID=153376 RepID=A0ABN1NI83_9PSEU
MTVTAMTTARRNGAIPCTNPARPATSHNPATSASGSVHEATAPLLAALADAVTAAAARGINDTGARETAAALRDARIALDVAIIAAGRALADREVNVRVDPAVA